jgi:acyl dehydratase
MVIHDRRDWFGRYLDEFAVGDVYKHWPGKTITESDNNLFSLLTMNHNPLHLDAEYMKSHQHGRILVAGPLIFGIAVGLSVPDTSGKAIANLAYDQIRHHAPVFVGDTVYAETKVLDLRRSSSKPDRGTVAVETTVYNQEREKVLSFQRTILIPDRKR